ncbi:MAG: hypothetical protein AAGD88_17525 [Bacteroidota bacterium]
MKNNWPFIFSVAIVISLSLSSCSDDNTEPETQISQDDVRGYTGTQSPGDVWSFNLNFTTSTFTGMWDNGTLTNTTDDVALTGTFSMLSSGFLKLVLTDATPDRPSLPEDGSAIFYAKEIEELALFAQPAGSLTGPVIVAAEMEDCISSLATYNYIVAAPPSTTYNPNIEEAYGSINLSGTFPSFSVDGQKKSLDCIGGICTLDTPLTPVTGNCIGMGELDVTGARGQVTSNGVFMLDSGPGNGGIFGLRTDTSITSADITGTTLQGFAFVPSNNISEAVQLDFAGGAPSALAQIFSNLETNTIDTGNLVTVTLSSFTDGLVTGTMTHNSGATTNLAGALAKNGTDRILVMIGTTDEILEPAFLIVLGT